MKLTIETKNRRQFLKNFSLSAAIITLAPDISFGKTTINGKISISFLNTPPEKTMRFSKFFSQNQDFIVKENCLEIDILYLHSGRYDDLQKSEEKLSTSTILIVNQQNFDANSLADLQRCCNNTRTFLLMVEENLHESSRFIFSKATLHEPFSCNTTKIENIIKSISFLNHLTRQNQFFTVNQSLTLNNTVI